MIRVDMQEDVLFFQRFLKSSNLYNGELDGLSGPALFEAYQTFRFMSDLIANEMGTFDKRSERNIITLMLPVQRIVRNFLTIAKEYDCVVKIISGTRTYWEQDKLYAQGRTVLNRPIITNAKGGQSNHNFGLAWDMGLFDKIGIYMKDDTKYIDFASFILSRIEGVEWGGDWNSLKDYSHYQSIPSTYETSVLRLHFEAGSLFAKRIR